MAIFLFSIFTMFAVFQILGMSPSPDLNSDERQAPRRAPADARKDVVEQRQEAIKERDERAADDPRRARYVEQIAEADKELQNLNLAAKALHDAGEEPDIVNVNTGWHALDHGIEKWKKNPALMIYKLQSSIYKFSWLLIPLSLPFVWLLFFWKRQYKLYDHTVFITYSIAFMSLLFILLTVAGAGGATTKTLGTVGLVVPFIHMTRQMKQAYALRWRSAILRSVIMSFFILIILMLFLALLVLMGMFG
jgi:hypothetical protein